MLSYETEIGIDLIHICVTSLAKEISEFMELTPPMQRMDSMMIGSKYTESFTIRAFLYMYCKPSKSYGQQRPYSSRKAKTLCGKG